MELVNKTTEIQNETNTINIISEVKTSYTAGDLQLLILDIQKRKGRLVKQSQRIKQDYDELSLEEAEYQMYLDQLNIQTDDPNELTPIE